MFDSIKMVILFNLILIGMFNINASRKDNWQIVL